MAKDVADESVQLLSRPYLAGVGPKLTISVELLVDYGIDASA